MSESRRRPSRWWYVVFALGLVGLGIHLFRGGVRAIPFSEFKHRLSQGEVHGTVEVGEHSVRGELRDGTRFETVPPPRTEVAPLLDGKVEYTGRGGGSPGQWLWLVIAAAVRRGREGSRKADHGKGGAFIEGCNFFGYGKLLQSLVNEGAKLAIGFVVLKKFIGLPPNISRLVRAIIIAGFCWVSLIRSSFTDPNIKNMERNPTDRVTLTQPNLL